MSKWHQGSYNKTFNLVFKNDSIYVMLPFLNASCCHGNILLNDSPVPASSPTHMSKGYGGPASVLIALFKIILIHPGAHG